MKKVLIISTALLLLGAVTSCNKVKSTSKKLIKSGEWKVTELSVDGINEEELPHWEIEDCEIYDESCFGEWKNDEGGHAEFVWQFREKAETFEISYQSNGHEEHEGEEEEHEHDHAAEEAAEQAFNFSGTYTVKENKRNTLTFISNTTLGYQGSEVKITIEKE